MANKLNKDVYIWTVNEEEDIKRVLNFKNLKGIITDFPMNVKQLIDERQA